METRLVREEQLKALAGKMPQLPTVHFKIVMVGEQTLAKHNHNPAEVCQEVEQQPGFYIIADSFETLRTEMHNLVDRFLAKVTENHESKEQG